jgi:hypothetical protein
LLEKRSIPKCAASPGESEGKKIHPSIFEGFRTSDIADIVNLNILAIP